MDVREAVNIVRVRRLDDNAIQANGTRGTSLWSDDEIIAALSEAQNEAVIRADLLRDEFTASICSIPIVANQVLYPLHPSVYRVDKDCVTYGDTGRALQLTDEEAMRRGGPCSGGEGGGYYDAYGWRPSAFGGHWDQAVESRSRFYLVKADARGRLYLRPWPIGNVATYTDTNGVDQPLTLNIAVYRKPIWPLRAPSDQFEINDKYHHRLIDFAIGRLLEKRDNDAGDPQGSANYFAKFDASFGARDSARTDTGRSERRRETVQPWGIM